MRPANATFPILVALGMAWAAVALAADGSTTTTRATVPESKARTIALAAVPGGTVQSAELEHEKGALVWSFDIQRAGMRTVTEILVDAKTGRIMSKKNETLAEQAKEAKADNAPHPQ